MSLFLRKLILIANLQTCVFVAIVFVGAHPLEASAGQRTDSPRTQWRNGEVNSAELDVIRNEALGIGAGGSRVPAIEGHIIIVAQLGGGEQSRLRNWRRLHNIRAYLVKHGIKPERIVTSERVASPGKATVRIFLGGRLRLTIMADRNKDIQVDCCEEFPEYYPWRKGRPVLD